MWKLGRPIIQGTDAVRNLIEFDKENVPKQRIQRAKQIIENERFNGFEPQHVSKALAGIFDWVKAMITFSELKVGSTPASQEESKAPEEPLYKSVTRSDFTESPFECPPHMVEFIENLDNLSEAELMEIRGPRNPSTRLILTLFAACLIVNTPKKTHKAALDNQDHQKMWDFAVKELNGAKGLVTKLINYNHAKLKNQRELWAKQAIEGVKPPSEKAGVAIWKWVNEALGQPSDFEESKTDSPFKTAESTNDLDSITHHQFSEFKGYSNPPLSLIKTLLGAWVALNGTTPETSQIIGNAYEGGWAFLKEHLLFEEFITPMKALDSIDPMNKVVVQIIISGPEFSPFVPINGVHAAIQGCLNERV